MKVSIAPAMALAASMITGCSEQQEAAVSLAAMSEEEHLACAAKISAFDRLLGEGKVAAMPDGTGDRLVAMMTHLNSYAIPQNIREPDAFAALNALREQFLAEQKPDAIRADAMECIGVAVEALG
ncbi:hypothetical protein [Parerythrobacter lacustris]|uniref:Lipoprotein n=1 Tax=Parerythrobacter lacustris TaxID=2969984 RepID=A0ABT1XML9_9SPHN|nr:hypothetical protein [Parerythrobacter lacustris]MCR2832908.1 hypothetical protein [Parerythrobacter lacustris]